MSSARRSRDRPRGRWRIRAAGITVSSCRFPRISAHRASTSSSAVAFVRWWAPLAVVAGIVAFMTSGVALRGTALTTAFFGIFAYALARSPELRRSLLS